MDVPLLLNRITELEHENCILRHKLDRSEQNRGHLDAMLKTRNAELEESRRLIRTAEENNRVLIFRDQLTGLSNRSYFNSQLEKIVEDTNQTQGSAALLFIDLNYFKKVNSHLGHSVGDTVLIQTAQRLLSCVRKNELIARLGGDEFAVVLPEQGGRSDAEFIARRVLKKIAEPFYIDGTPYYIGVSIGIARYPEDASNAEQLLQYADTAMYRVKKSGQSSYQFYQKQNGE